MQSGSKNGALSPNSTNTHIRMQTASLRDAAEKLDKCKCDCTQSQGITSALKVGLVSTNTQCAKIGKQIFYIRHREGFFSRSPLSASDRFKSVLGFHGPQTWMVRRGKFNSVTGFICWANISLQVHQICFHQRFIFIGHTCWEILLNPRAMGFVCTSIHLALERLRFSDRPQTLLKQKPFLTSFI